MDEPPIDPVAAWHERGRAADGGGAGGAMSDPQEQAMGVRHGAIAIIPCDDLDESEAFYERLGFAVTANYPRHGYRILHDPRGASVHLTRTEPGWVVPERNAYGVYFYAEDVGALAASLGCIVEEKPWGLIEFALSDPSGTLVRVGWPV